MKRGRDSKKFTKIWKDSEMVRHEEVTVRCEAHDQNAKSITHETKNVRDEPLSDEHE